MDQTPKLRELVQNEITVLKRCCSDNVIRYIDSFQSASNVYILMEFCNGGDLEKYIERKGRLRED
jgi:serine/threonine-protein kinase ULK/ATG1